jgi:hypothetical protein
MEKREIFLGFLCEVFMIGERDIGILLERGLEY